MLNISEAGIQSVLIQSLPPELAEARYGPDIYEGLTDKETSVFKNIFLSPFNKTITTHEFVHDVDPELNVLQKICGDFMHTRKLEARGKDIFQHLKTTATHPQIKTGELVIVHYDNVQYESKFYEALGIYKIEEKEQFIETADSKRESTFRFREGVSSRKVKKAALVILSEEAFSVLVIDNASSPAEYWRDAFLGVRERSDSASNTTQFLNMTKNYVTTQLPSDFEVSRTDQIDLLNRSANYFKEKQEFKLEEFETEVLQDEAVIKSFRSFDNHYREENNIEIEDDFQISTPAAKKQLRAFKSVLKLDSNFHIYIHGDRQLIEKGVDPDGKKFYKIYFEEET